MNINELFALSEFLRCGYIYINNANLIQESNGTDNIPFWGIIHDHEGPYMCPRETLIKYTLEYSKITPDINYIIFKGDSSLRLENDSDCIANLKNTRIFVTCQHIKIKNVYTLPTPWTGELEEKFNYSTCLSKKRWIDKIPKCVWRGKTNSTSLHRIGSNNNLLGLRQFFVKKLSDNSYCDVGYTEWLFDDDAGDWGNKYKYMKSRMSIFEMSEYKIILVFDGWGWPGSIRWALESGSIPIIFSDMHPGFLKHFVENEEYFTAKSDGSDVISIIHKILNLDEKQANTILYKLKVKCNTVFSPKTLQKEYRKLFLI